MDEILVDENGYNQYYQKLQELRDKKIINAQIMSKAFNDFIGDGWHDNPVYEEAMRIESMIDNDIQNMLDKQHKLKIVNDIYDEKHININDVLEIEFIYSDNDKEIEKIKQTGNYISNSDLEVTLNSPIGKAIYKKKIGGIYEYVVNDKIIKVHIIKRCK